MTNHPTAVEVVHSKPKNVLLMMAVKLLRFICLAPWISVKDLHQIFQPGQKCWTDIHWASLQPRYKVMQPSPPQILKSSQKDTSFPPANLTWPLVAGWIIDVRRTSYFILYTQKTFLCTRNPPSFLFLFKAERTAFEFDCSAQTPSSSSAHKWWPPLQSLI